MEEERTRYDDFDRMMLRHRKLIKALCWWRASGDASVCADLMQEVLMAMWQRRATIREGTGVQQEKAWVRLQCRSVFSHIGRRHRVETVPMDEAMAKADESRNLRAEIEDMASVLTDHEHRILDMILDGYTASEIARHLGIKAASVSQARQRIIQKMRKEI